MEASSAYQRLIARGERKILLQLGRKRFGPPAAETLARIEALDEPAEVERLCDRLLEVSSWEELFAPPAASLHWLSESSTYRLILAEGGQRYLLHLGRLKYGEPDATILARIKAIDELDDLIPLALRLLDVSSWQELFAQDT